MRGLGKINFMQILKMILLHQIAGPLGMLMAGGGSIMNIVMALVLRPVIGPHISNMLGGLTNTVGGFLPNAA